jgi:hypothetical protein
MLWLLPCCCVVLQLRLADRATAGVKLEAHYQVTSWISCLASKLIVRCEAAASLLDTDQTTTAAAALPYVANACGTVPCCSCKQQILYTGQQSAMPALGMHRLAYHQQQMIAGTLSNLVPAANAVVCSRLRDEALTCCCCLLLCLTAVV